MTKLKEDAKVLLGMDEELDFVPVTWESLTPILSEQLGQCNLVQEAIGIFVTVGASTIIRQLNGLKKDLRSLYTAKENVEKNIESQE